MMMNADEGNGDDHNDGDDDHLLFGHLHIGHSKGGVGGSHGFKTTKELGRTTTKRFYKISD